MAKSKKRGGKRGHGSNRDRRNESPDRPAIDLLLVSWSVAVVTTLITEIGAAAASWYAHARPGVKSEALAGLLLFASVVIGTISLLLALVVYAGGFERPPRGLFVFSLVVSALPIAVVMIRMFG